jgi:hypothetical protein
VVNPFKIAMVVDVDNKAIGNSIIQVSVKKKNKKSEIWRFPFVVGCFGHNTPGGFGLNTLAGSYHLKSIV